MENVYPVLEYWKIDISIRFFKKSESVRNNNT